MLFESFFSIYTVLLDPDSFPLLTINPPQYPKLAGAGRCLRFIRPDPCAVQRSTLSPASMGIGVGGNYTVTCDEGGPMLKQILRETSSFAKLLSCILMTDL